MEGEKPVYSVSFDEEGNLLKLSYPEGRKLYCKYYEKLVKDKKDYLKLDIILLFVDLMEIL